MFIAADIGIHQEVYFSKFDVLVSVLLVEC